jgi:hypothetical protein
MKMFTTESLKIKTFTLAVILFTVLFTAVPDFAQTTESAETTESQKAIEEAPRVVEQPAYEYYYWPEEDLNNFGLSTMGNGKSGSTLGEKTRRTSNIEANAYFKSRKENNDNAGNEDQPEDSKESNEPTYIEPVAQPRAHSASEKPIYEWTDENGTIHITNDLGQVPPEYQNQFYESEPQDSGQ